MSVLIKGMEMSKEGCKDCALVMRKSVCDYCPILKQEVSGNVERGGRPTNCPLVDVPSDLPTADVVEVVRCKDCEWWKLSEYNTFGIHVCKKFSGVRGEHDFCSRGERRE